MQSLWMLLACAMFATMGATIKLASDSGASLSQIVLFRGAPSVALLLAWVLITRRTIRPPTWRLHFWRNLSGVTAMWMSFYALSQLPLATATSLNYTSPLFIASWLLFRSERGRQRDWVRVLAVALGFVGVIGILRPSIGHEHLQAGLIGLVAGAFSAVAMIQVTELGRIGEPEWRTVFYFSLCVCLTSLVGLGYTGWHPLNSAAWFSLLGVGASGLVGQLAMTRAFGSGSTLLTAALQYATIIFATLLGAWIWGDVPDVMAWMGIVLVIGAGLLSTWRTYMQSKVLTPSASARRTA